MPDAAVDSCAIEIAENARKEFHNLLHHNDSHVVVREALRQAVCLPDTVQHVLNEALLIMQ